MNRSPPRLSLPLAASFALQALALAIFVQGFLLTRVELPQASSCNDSLSASWPSEGTHAPGMGGSNSEAPCWGRPRFKRLVLIIVDALRYDFVVPSQPDGNSSMPKLMALHSAAGKASMLAKFVADPPTTTMQRLKGLFTGSLPTFLDVGHAFSATHVSEDNLFSQLSVNGRRIAFVGDDTWQDLFPEHLHQAWPFPSLNVHDLHTVDEGVWEHMPHLLAAPDGDRERGYEAWDLVIGHTLGVDHAGHTFNANSEEMRQKLAETDERVARLLEAVLLQADDNGPHNDTLLLVMGDHGQTINGDHGGGTHEETDSVLIGFSLPAMRHAIDNRTAAARSSPSAGLQVDKRTTSMPQLQLLPTLSLLLGLPIPFGSIGSVSPELWGLGQREAAGHEARDLSDALSKNAWQVARYLRTYHGGDGLSGRFNAQRMAECMTMYRRAQVLHGQLDSAQGGSPEAAIAAQQAFLDCAAQLCRDQWTQFLMGPMVLGILLMAASLASQLWQWRPYLTSATWEGPGMLLAVGFNAVMHLSDSYIWEEPRVVTLLVAWSFSCLLLQVLRLQHEERGSRTPGAGPLPSSWLRRPVVLWVVALASSRAMAAAGHPPPQHREVPPDTLSDATWAFLRRGQSLPMDFPALPGTHSWLLLGAVLLASMISGAHRSSPLSQATHILGVLFPVALILGWHSAEDISGCRDVTALQAARWMGYARLSSELWGFMEIPLRLLVPRIVFATTSLSAVLRALVATGSCAMRWPHARESTRPTHPSASTAAHSAGLAWTALPFLVLLYGREGPLLACLAMLQLWAFKELLTARMAAAADCGPWICIYAGAFLALLGQHLFFCTGHTAQFAGLQYTAGFVGYDDFNYVRAGFLLAANTFGPHVVSALLVPLMAVSFDASRSETLDSRTDGSNGERGEHVRSAGVLLAVQGYATVRSCSMLLSTFGAALHRRHLMAWSLFAPKFVFEGISFLVTHLALMAASSLAGVSPLSSWRPLERGRTARPADAPPNSAG